MPEKTPSSDLVKLGRARSCSTASPTPGCRTGFVHLGNCDKFSISMATETIKMKNYRPAPPPVQGGARLDRGVGRHHRVRVLALGVRARALGRQGVPDADRRRGDGRAARDCAQSEKGKLYGTLKRNISSVAVKQGATTLLVGVDYEVFNAKRGVIRILPTSPSFLEGTAVTVDYTAETITAVSANAVAGRARREEREDRGPPALPRRQRRGRERRGRDLEGEPLAGRGAQLHLRRVGEVGPQGLGARRLGGRVRRVDRQPVLRPPHPGRG
jgi:hypothetical protein